MITTAVPAELAGSVALDLLPLAVLLGFGLALLITGKSARPLSRARQAVRRGLQLPGRAAVTTPSGHVEVPIAVRLIGSAGFYAGLAAYLYQDGLLAWSGIALAAIGLVASIA
ncbi:hypothetical protein ACIQF6_28470 [Kitasatospora sp. NPDC092948]|uniref:hypothetical protein n=1 Tax=Kitasatospora sp. NPDC092948 TaxID=3364088 RepID=UPI0037FD58E4